MGILNITPDSFSDGGEYNEPEKALSRVNQFLEEGVDLIDIGAQSTRPGAEIIGAEEELNRLIPCMNLIRQTFPNIIISVDTFHSTVAKKALNKGANWVNDISGGRLDPNMHKIISELGCPYVLTHSRGNSKTMNKLTTYKDLIIDVKHELNFYTDLAIEAGISPGNIIWDPGIGFAKTTKQNIEILKNLESFTKDSFPVLIGPSKKRFIGDVLELSNTKERIWGTAAVISRCVQGNVSIVRVHDVQIASYIINMTKLIF